MIFFTFSFLSINKVGILKWIFWVAVNELKCFVNAGVFSALVERAE